MSDGKEFVKTLFNAKTQAEEFYQDPLVEWKPIVYESQLESMAGFYNDESKWAKTRAWIEEHFDVVEDPLRREEMLLSWKRIHQMLDEQYYNRINLIGIAPQRGGKTWLGSQIEQQYRAAEDRALSKLRHSGVGSYYFVTDEQDSLYSGREGSAHGEGCSESDALLIADRIQRGSICRRTSSCGMA